MPRSRHKWLFGSNMGFAGNAKYLFIYLNEHPDEGIRPLWIAKNRQELKQMKAMGLEAFRRWSAKGTYHALTSNITYITVTPPTFTRLPWGVPSKSIYGMA